MIDIEKLSKSGSTIECFKNGQIIIKDGESICEKMYILLDGTADVFKNYQEEGEIKIGTLKRGDFFGEMSLFLNRKRTATVVANDDVTTLTISHEEALDFFVKQPEITYSLIQTLCSRLESTNVSMADNSVKYEQNITSLNNEKSELAVAANVDELTGIYNRRYFTKTARMQIKDAIKENKNAFIVIYDLDYFKKVNDTYGHKAGDIVLKSTADRVNRTIRSCDLFARYGGEEFILLITNIEKEALKGLIERVRLNVRNEPIEFEGCQIFVSASFGIAAITLEGDFNMAVSLADEALYKAKNTGRDRVVFFEDSDIDS